MLKSYNLWPSHKMSFSLCLLLWMHAVYDTKTVKVHLSIHPSLAQFRVIGEGVGGGCVYPSWNRVRGSLYPEELLTSKAVNCLGLQASGRPSLRAGKLMQLQGAKFAMTSLRRPHLTPLAVSASAVHDFVSTNLMTIMKAAQGKWRGVILLGVKKKKEKRQKSS